MSEYCNLKNIIGKEEYHLVDGIDCSEVAEDIYIKYKDNILCGCKICTVCCGLEEKLYEFKFPFIDNTLNNYYYHTFVLYEGKENTYVVDFTTQDRLLKFSKFISLLKENNTKYEVYMWEGYFKNPMSYDGDSINKYINKSISNNRYKVY